MGKWGVRGRSGGLLKVARLTGNRTCVPGSSPGALGQTPLWPGKPVVCKPLAVRSMLPSFSSPSCVASGLEAQGWASCPWILTLPTHSPYVRSQSPLPLHPGLLALSATSGPGAASSGRKGNILPVSGLGSSQGAALTFPVLPGPSWVMVNGPKTPRPGQLPPRSLQGTLLQAGFLGQGCAKELLGNTPNGIHKPSKETRLGWL